MTSYLLAGYLALVNGRRVSSENPNTHKTTNHMYYDTVIQTSGVDVPAELRYWVPATATPLPDGTVVDVLAKMNTPANSKALLDAIQFVPFPGDPASDSYEEGIPDRPFPTLFVLGHTSGAAETMDDGVSVGYEVQTSEYVRDQSRGSRVYCRFDGNKPRWKKTPRPPSGSAVFVLGLAYGVHLAGGNIMVDVDQVQLNVGGTAATSSPPRVEAGGSSATPAKRRRFPTATEPSATSQRNSDEVPSTEVVLDPNSSGGSTVSHSEEPVANGSKVRKIGTRRKIARVEEAEE